MSGGSPSHTTTTTNVQYPAWLQGPMIDNINYANQLANQMSADGYQYYNPGDRIAPMNQLQLNAMSNAQNSMGQWTPFLNQAANSNSYAQGIAMNAASPYQAAYAGPSSLVQAGQLQDSNLAGYMNPYTNLVTMNALGGLEESRQMQNKQNADAMTKAGAFGGSRHGVIESMTNQGFAKQASDLALQSAQGNFLNAQQMASADIDRNLQGQLANQGAWNNMNQFNAQLGQQGDLSYRGLGLDAARFLQSGAGMDADLAARWQQMNSNDLNNLLTAGNMLQDQDQLGRDFAYQEWLNARQFPLDVLGIRYSAVNNTPYQPGSSTSAPVNRNRAGGFLGGATTGYMAMGGPANPYAWIGAVAGGLLGAYG